MTRLSGADADYLAAYLDIVERFCGMGMYRWSRGDDGQCKERPTLGTISRGAAHKELDDLNIRSKEGLSSGVLKKKLPAERLAHNWKAEDSDEDANEDTYEEGAWMPSEVC